MQPSWANTCHVFTLFSKIFIALDMTRKSHDCQPRRKEPRSLTLVRFDTKYQWLQLMVLTFHSHDGNLMDKQFLLQATRRLFHRKYVISKLSMLN
jgi:hypothetical protein